MTTNTGVYHWSQDPTGHPKLHMKIRLEVIKIGSTEIRYYMASRMESGYFTAHLFVKLDLQNFDFTWQLDLILP